MPVWEWGGEGASHALQQMASPGLRRFYHNSGISPKPPLAPSLTNFPLSTYRLSPKKSVFILNLRIWCLFSLIHEFAPGGFKGEENGFTEMDRWLEIVYIDKQNDRLPRGKDLTKIWKLPSDWRQLLAVCSWRWVPVSEPRGPSGSDLEWSNELAGETNSKDPRSWQRCENEAHCS